MKKSIWSVFLGFVCLTIVVSGCTPAANASATTITTSVGDVVITKVEIVSEDAFGSKPAPGYQILYVWFESADGSDIDGSAFYDASGDVYIMGNDGSKTNSYTGGLMSGALMVGFTPPTSANKFTLFWPGNDPVELILSQ